jgi:hypothetical protein
MQAREVITTARCALSGLPRFFVTFGLAAYGVVVSVAMVALVVVTVVTDLRDPTSTEVVRRTVKAYAFEAYPSWTIAHPWQSCPASLRDLDPYLKPPPVDDLDMWGAPYRLVCGPGSLKVLSAGEDAKFGTADDVRSDQ